MDAYIGLETAPGSQNTLYAILNGRKIDAHLTLGAYEIICRLPSFANLDEFRKVIDSILYTMEKGRPIVENTTTFVIMNHHRKNARKRPTAFCFLRSGRLPSRAKFDKMVADILSIPTVLAVSVVIGFFDIVCEVISKDVAELKTIMDKMLSTPGVSPSTTMICLVVEPHGSS
jgi:DNA-binding Lrp family transcriptional regulator